MEGKEKLRSDVQAAREAKDKASRALKGHQQKLKHMREQQTKQAPHRKVMNMFFEDVASAAVFGEPIRPVFEEEPELEKAAEAFKKLSDEEEKRK